MQHDLVLNKRLSILKKYFFSTLFLLILLSCLLPENINAATIYVSTDGNNDNSGITMKESIPDINKAIDMAAAGDTIVLLKGTYKQIINLENKNGQPDKSIFIKGFL